MYTSTEIILQNASQPSTSLNAEELLALYYRPLVDYQTPSQTGQLSEPLWRLRQIALEEAKFEDKLMEATKKNSSSDEISLLVRLSYQCSQVPAPPKSARCFSDLSDDEKISLLKIAAKREQNSVIKDVIQLPASALYATSLLITLFLRDKNKSYRSVALSLLEEGGYSKDIRITSQGNLKVNLKLIDKDLLQVPYIDFSYSNFTELGVIKKINLSGQYLKRIKAEGTTFKASSGCSFRYACLHGAVLHEANLKGCDFTGASLWGADLKKTNIEEGIFDKANAHGLELQHTKAKSSKWRQATLQGACLDNADFTEAVCEQTEVAGASLSNTILIQTNFRQALGLSAAQLKEAAKLDKCQLSTQSFSRTDTEALLNSKEKGTVEFTVDQQVSSLSRLEQLSAAYIRGEQIAGQGPSPAWPKENKRWIHDKEWHGNQTQATLCDLTPEDELYPVLERFIHLTSDTLSYQSKRFEFARLKKAYESGQLTSFVGQELHQPPSHQGRLGSIQIHRIQLNDHPALWKKYQEKKKAIQLALTQEGIRLPLAQVDWHRGSMTGELPVINSAIGECWLFHGTGPSVMPLIIQNGFTTKYASKKMLVGYGALGKGIYCSDAFAKVATYVTCPGCQQNQCQCSPEKREQASKNKKEMKAFFVARVILGKVFIDHNKSRTHAEGLPEGYHSAWGPYRESTPDSAFDRNEFIVGDDAQIYPEFCVFYTDNAPGLEQIPAPSANAFPPLQTKQTNPSPAWQYLKKDLDDYYRLKKAPVWQREQNLSALQNDIQCLYNQSPTKEQRQYLDALQIEIKPQVESLLTLQNAFSKEHTLYWALDYYDYRQWVQTLYVLQTLDQETLSQEWLLRVALMQATAFYHLHQFSDMIDAINRAYAIDAKTVENYLQHTESSHLQASYYSKGLEALQHSNAKDEDSFCQRIAIWAAKQLYTHVWEFNQWTCHYWALSSTKTRDFFREALQTLVGTNSSLPKGLKEFAEHIPDDRGNRLSVKKTRQDFHQALFSF